jgi:hypothetical protein
MLIHSAVITGSVQFNNTDVSGITNVSSFATTASVDAVVLKTGSFATTSSVNELQSKTGSYTSTSSFGAYSSSINTFTSSATTRLNTIESVTGSYASTSSVNNLQSKTGSYATTGSNQFNGNQSISGSITSNGTITAQTLVVQTVTSSVEFVTGSTRNGSLSSDTHQFTGSLFQTGSTAAFMGNVGIGTTTASSRLQVRGVGTYNNNFSATNATVQIISDEMSVNQWYPTFNIAMVRQSLLIGQNSFGGIGFTTIDDSNNSGQYDAARIAIVNDNGVDILTGTSMAFYTQVGGVSNTNPATERGRITSGGNWLLGTSTDGGFRLNVSGSTRLNGNTTVTGSIDVSGSITSNGTITAQTLVVQTVTSSIEFVTGSTRNGSIAGNTHQFTGSVGITGSLTGTTATFSGADLTVTGASTQPFLRVARTGTGVRSYYWGINGGSTLFLQDETAGVTRITLTAANVMTLSSDVIVTGTLNSQGQLITSAGQTGGYVAASSGYVNETQTVSTNGTSYYLYKYTGTANGSSSTIFNITGMSTTNGTYADIYAVAQKDATASGINTNLEVQINGQYMVGIQAGGTSATTVRNAFRVCRMDGSWIIIGTVRS